MKELESLGWDAAFAEAFREHAQEGLAAGRVAYGHRNVFSLLTAAGERKATVTGRLRHDSASAADLPAVGDWVAFRARQAADTATIHAVLPRRSAFSRKLAGEATDEQVVAANIDTLFLVCGLDRDFNPRRLERSLTLAWESGAVPVVLLSKADACPAPGPKADETRSAAPGVAVHVISARAGTGLDALTGYLGPGRTVALVGSSGVGKSTLVNRLVGRDVQETREVRARDGRGRHATTRRELIGIPGGGWLIDTPGLRELQLWAEGAGLDHAFDDVATLALGCRFRNCGHGDEPGCAVRAGMDGPRLESYRKLQAELRSLAARQDQRAQAVEKGRVRSIHSQAKHFRPRG